MLKWVFGTDTGPFRKGLQEMRGEVSKFEGDLKSKILGAIGAAAVIGAFKKVISAASDLNESVSKSGVVFEESSKKVEDWADGMAKSFGQSKRQAIDSAAGFGDLLQELDLAPEKLADMSMGLVELASDMASFKNVPIDQALAAIRSGLVGESEPLRNLGIKFDEATLKQAAMSKGLYDGTGALSSAAKMQAVYGVIMAKSSLSQGDFSRTADSAANSQRVVAAQAENTAAAIGSKLLPLYQSLLKILKEMDTGKAGSKFGSALAYSLRIVISGFYALRVAADTVLGALAQNILFMANNAVTAGKIIKDAFTGNFDQAKKDFEGFKNNFEMWKKGQSRNATKAKSDYGEFLDKLWVTSSPAGADQGAKKPPPILEDSTNDTKVVEDRKRLEEDISRLQEEARLRQLTLEGKINDAIERRKKLEADNLSNAYESSQSKFDLEDAQAKLDGLKAKGSAANVEELKSAQRIRNEMFEKSSAADTIALKSKRDLLTLDEQIQKLQQEKADDDLKKQEQIVKLRDDYREAGEANAREGMTDAERLNDLKARQSKFSTESANAPDEKTKLEKGIEARKLQPEIDSIRNKISEDEAKQRKNTGTIAASSLGAIGGGGSVNLLGPGVNPAQRTNDLLSVIDGRIADIASTLGGGGKKVPEPI